MQETIDAPRAAVSLCADLSQPVSVAAIGSFSQSFAKGLERVTATAYFRPPGMQMVGTMSYADAPSASAGASGIEQAGTLANLVALTGLTPKLEDLAVSAVDTNVKVAFSVDEQAMRALLVLVPKYVH
jgi:hypothetical protein